MTSASGWCGSCPGHRFGDDLAAGTYGVAAAQNMDVAGIARVAFTSEDHVREVIHNFNADGFDSLYPRYRGGHPPKFTLPERREIKKLAKTKPAEHGLPLSTWSVSELADFLVAEGVVDDISPTRACGSCCVTRALVSTHKDLESLEGHELPGQEGPDRAPVRDRRRRGHARARGAAGHWCLDEFGPLNLMPHQGWQWAERGGRLKDPERDPRPRRRATYNRHDGVRHLFAAYNLTGDRLFEHVKPRKRRVQFLEFCRYIRSLHPVTTRIAIVCDNLSPHLTSRKDSRVGDWAAAHNIEAAYTPANSSWLNRIEAQFSALRYFALDGTDHPSHTAQARMILRYITWRNTRATDPRLRKVVARANVA